MISPLFDLLRTRANHRGLVLLREAVLLEALSIERRALTVELNALEASGEIEVLSPLPFLVVRLKKWPAHWTIDRKTGPNLEQHRRIPKEVPVSSAAAATQQEDGGAGEGEALLGEVLTVLGPSADRKEFALILAGQPPELVRRCLRRVQATKSFRVSRAALFRSLLGKLSH